MTPFIANATTFFSALTVLIDMIIAVVIIVLIIDILASLPKKKRAEKKKPDWFTAFVPYALLVSFLASLAGVCGSLFYSEIAGFAPCELCWWQRIFLFPQVIILSLALWHRQKNKNVEYFALSVSLALSFIGGFVALYQSYGQLVNPDVLPDCAVTGVSCAKLYFLDFGFVTIPTMSLTLFVLLVLSATLYFSGKKTALQ